MNQLAVALDCEVSALLEPTTAPLPPLPMPSGSFATSHRIRCLKNYLSRSGQLYAASKLLWVAKGAFDLDVLKPSPDDDLIHS